jgi:hypothetical protein
MAETIPIASALAILPVCWCSVQVAETAPAFVSQQPAIAVSKIIGLSRLL